MNKSQTYQTNGARGTKIIKQTGQDTSSFGDTSAASIKNSGFKGGVGDISSSIKDGKVRSY